MNNNLIEKSYINKAQTTPKEIILNEEQGKAYEDIMKKITTFSPNLIEGVTGSGKTELYIKIVKDIISCGGQALILVPE